MYHCFIMVLFAGHGADVKCVEWHPQKSLVASGSKDTQQPLKLWDPRMGESLATVWVAVLRISHQKQILVTVLCSPCRHAHKHTVMELSFNKNGNWLLTASRDHLLKLFDVRNLKEELQSFRGHKKEATSELFSQGRSLSHRFTLYLHFPAVAWHPIHEQLFASGGSDGSIMYWMVGSVYENSHQVLLAVYLIICAFPCSSDKEVGNIDEAHDNMVWSLAWHPLGHILVSGSNDHTT